MLTSGLDINESGHLTVGGVDTVMLAEKYGTPLYIMNEDVIRENCRSYVTALDKYYDGYGMIAYASKAFNTRAMCSIVNSENMGIDVVSGGELYTAKSVNFPSEKIVFHGNNKTAEELIMAIEYGVGRIVVDNIFELRLLDTLAKAANKKINIMLRIKPGVDAHTHDFIRTGQIDSKFGFALETGEAFEAVKLSLSAKNLKLSGLHCHIGSQIFDIEPFCHASEIMLDFMRDIRDNLGITLSELNMGGGFGIKYVEGNNPPSYTSFVKEIIARIKLRCEKNSYPLPFLIFEPGRSIVGEAGTTLYTVGGIKNIPNIRTYVSVDGGMCDNPRYALYKSEYSFTVANRASEEQLKNVTIAGKCCESGDILGENVALQDAKIGDILAVMSTGAYNYSMSSNYNRNPTPAVIAIHSGKDRVIVRRQTYEDIVRNDEL